MATLHTWLGCGFRYFFPSYLGSWSNWTSILLEMGWFNHQLVKLDQRHLKWIHEKPLKTNMTGWKIPVLNRKYIDSFMVDFPASHVSFQGRYILFKLVVGSTTSCRSKNPGWCVVRGISPHAFLLSSPLWKQEPLWLVDTVPEDVRSKLVTREASRVQRCFPKDPGMFMGIKGTPRGTPPRNSRPY